MQRIVTFKVTEELLRALDYYARTRKMSRSEVIREALKYYLKNNGIDLKKFEVAVEETRRENRGMLFEIVIE